MVHRFIKVGAHKLASRFQPPAIPTYFVESDKIISSRYSETLLQTLSLFIYGLKHQVSETQTQMCIRYRQYGLINYIVSYRIVYYARFELPEPHLPTWDCFLTSAIRRHPTGLLVAIPITPDKRIRTDRQCNKAFFFMLRNVVYCVGFVEAARKRFDSRISLAARLRVLNKYRILPLTNEMEFFVMLPSVSLNV